MKNKQGFLPNLLNKYGIRKLSAGTASLLIGATLVLLMDKLKQLKRTIPSLKMKIIKQTIANRVMKNWLNQKMIKLVTHQQIRL